MKTDPTTVKTTPLIPPTPKLPAEAEDGIHVESAGLFTAAHLNEVRNPLTTINMAVEMLHSMIVGEEEKKCLEIILRSSKRINAVATDLVTPQDNSSKE